MFDSCTFNYAYRLWLWYSSTYNSTCTLNFICTLVSNTTMILTHDYTFLLKNIYLTITNINDIIWGICYYFRLNDNSYGSNILLFIVLKIFTLSLR